MANTNTNNQSNYTWKLKNKTTGAIHPLYTFVSRSQARELIWNRGFVNFTPVKVYSKAASKSKKTGMRSGVLGTPLHKSRKIFKKR